MPALPPVRCERRFTACLSIRERHALLTFASQVAPRLQPAYLLQRLDHYEQVWIARRAARVSGFLLVHARPAPEATLVYIGPSFSRAGDYAYAFAGLLAERLRAADPFVIAMEVENPSVRRTLERLLPSHLFPRSTAEPRRSEALRDLSAKLLSRVPHVIDFDPRSMSSAVASPLQEGRGAARYAVLLVPCDGRLETRASIAREFARGLKALRTRAPQAPVARELRDG